MYSVMAGASQRLKAEDCQGGSHVCMNVFFYISGWLMAVLSRFHCRAGMEGSECMVNAHLHCN